MRAPGRNIEPGPACKALNPSVFGAVESKYVTAPDEVERESDLHNDILDFCRGVGWLALHGSTAHRTKRKIGEPDFVIFADLGRVFVVECKTKTGKLTPQQLGVKVQLESLGHKYFVVRSMAEFLSVTESHSTNPAAAFSTTEDKE